MSVSPGARLRTAWAQETDRVLDYGHRAIHATAIAAKEIVRTFYGAAAKYSYFESCSNGGRQALMEAQRYPEDFDGILAGAPFAYVTRLLSFGAVLGHRFETRPETRIPDTMLQVLEHATIAACDDWWPLKRMSTTAMAMTLARPPQRIQPPLDSNAANAAGTSSSVTMAARRLMLFSAIPITTPFSIIRCFSWPDLRTGNRL